MKVWRRAPPPANFPAAGPGVVVAAVVAGGVLRTPSRGPACGGAGAPSRGVSQAAGGAGRAGEGGGLRAVSGCGAGPRPPWRAPCAALFLQGRGGLHRPGGGALAAGGRLPPRSPPSALLGGVPPPQPEPNGSCASGRARVANFWRAVPEYK